MQQVDLKSTLNFKDFFIEKGWKIITMPLYVTLISLVDKVLPAGLEKGLRSGP